MKEREPISNPVEDILHDPAFDEAYLELTRYAYTRTRTRGEAEEVVSDTVLSWVQDVRAGKQIDNLTGYLHRVFERRLSDRLRRQYRREAEFCDDGTILNTIPDDSDPEELPTALREAEAVRKALGRLSAIYREVVYRHYMKGQGVEEIAAALGVPAGTVKSRLSDGRGQMKETVTAHLREDGTHPQTHSVQKMSMKNQKNTLTADTRPYAEASYAPKQLTIGIWGKASEANEPFCYLKSLVAQNILVLAYEKPISIRDLSAALAIPTPYVEFEVEKLIDGELLGKTAGGLVYTRIFLRTEEESFGDVAAQEALAAEIAPVLWRTLEEGLAPLWAEEDSPVRHFSAKQTAIFRLMLANRLLSETLFSPEMLQRPSDIQPLNRPRGGWWLATGTVYEYGQKLYTHKYSFSGPVNVGYSVPSEGGGESPMAMMLDYQSLFGDAHWRYGRFKHAINLKGMLRFYASLFTDTVQVEDDRVYEAVPELEEMGVLHRDRDGSIRPDIPGMTFAEWNRWGRAMYELIPAFTRAVKPAVRRLVEQTVNRVPDHVDGREAYIHNGALECLVPATMLYLAEQGYIPDVEVGKTPVILVVYRPSEEGEST